jgi:hypothetical protein
MLQTKIFVVTKKSILAVTFVLPVHWINFLQQLMGLSFALTMLPSQVLFNIEQNRNGRELVSLKA